MIITKAGRVHLQQHLKAVVILSLWGMWLGQNLVRALVSVVGSSLLPAPLCFPCTSHSRQHLSLHSFASSFFPETSMILNPNDAVPPNFASDAFIEDCQWLIDHGLTEDLATATLSDLWTIQNNKDRATWAIHQEEIAQADHETQVHTEALTAEKLHLQEEEESLLLWEEHKKNKAKFAPIPDHPASSQPIILPSQLALQKLKNHQFCELWFFTNEGLEEAKKSGSYASDDSSLSLLQTPDGHHAFVPSISAHDKADIIQNEDLSYFQFGTAAFYILSSMRACGWDESHITMHLKFFAAIDTYPYCHSTRDIHTWALIAYQATQRQYWHATIGSVDAFDLSYIVYSQLKTTLNDIVLCDQISELNITRTVCNVSPLNPFYLCSPYVFFFVHAIWAQFFLHVSSPSMFPLLGFIIFHCSHLRSPTFCSHLQNNTQLLGLITRFQNSATLAPSSASSSLTSVPALRHPHLSGRSTSYSPYPTSGSTPRPPRSFRNSSSYPSQSSSNTPACPVCLFHTRHDIVHCNAKHTWDDKFPTYSSCIGSAIIVKETGKQLCRCWQRLESCQMSHDTKHLCSGCGSLNHGVQTCPCAQKLCTHNSL